MLAIHGRVLAAVMVTGAAGAARLDMQSACTQAVCMAKMVQIRNVPELVHRQLKAKAARSGMSLSEFLLAEITQLAAQPTLEEMLTRLSTRKPVKLRVSAAAAVRKERDSA